MRNLVNILTAESLEAIANTVIKNTNTNYVIVDVGGKYKNFSGVFMKSLKHFNNWKYLPIRNDKSEYDRNYHLKNEK